ncbi:MAG: hypothetical protein Q9174_002185 [Haloplaca sp. 1 TL-2023]
MFYSTLLSVLLATLSQLLRFTYALPQPNLDPFGPEKSGIQMLPRAAVNGDLVQCIDNRPLQPSHRSQVNHCAKAIIALPSEADPGFFKNGGGIPQEYILPKETVIDDCRVTVSLTDGIPQEGSSWSQIRSTANSLVLSCQAVHGSGLELVTGGYTTTGDRGQIKIAIRNIRLSRPFPDQAESTNVTATA